MALREDWPAIRAEWAWSWLARGTLSAEPLFGTRVLLVLDNSRPQKTWSKDEERTTTKYWLGEGTLLVPRWDPLEEHFDPVVDAGVEKLSAEELRARGMIRVDGQILVLIYQHVDSALHFQRQQWHIRLERYAIELAKIQKQLNVLELNALGILAEAPADGRERLQALAEVREHRRDRRREIEAILSVGVAPREKAAEILVVALKRELESVQHRIGGIFTTVTFKKLRSGQPVDKEGLRAYLAGLYFDLEGIKVRPVVRRIKLAQRHLRLALGAHDVSAFAELERELKAAMGDIGLALPLLSHPPEKLEALRKA